MYAKKNYSVVGLGMPKSPNKWMAPPAGTIKINSNASLTDEGWVGLVMVARDHEGKVLVAATRRSQAFWAPKIAKAKGLLFALRLGLNQGWQDIILESDCKLIIDRLEKGASMLLNLIRSWEISCLYALDINQLLTFM